MRRVATSRQQRNRRRQRSKKNKEPKVCSFCLPFWICLFFLVPFLLHAHDSIRSNLFHSYVFKCVNALELAVVSLVLLLNLSLFSPSNSLLLPFSFNFSPELCPFFLSLFPSPRARIALSCRLSSPSRAAMTITRRTLLLLFAITACVCAIGACATSWRSILARPPTPHAHADPELDSAADAAASAANLTELSEFDLPSKQKWMMAAHLLSHRSSGVRVPLAGVSVLIHARLQSCRPTLPPDPRQLPPSLRRPPSNGRTRPSVPYAQLECVQAWAENVLLASNRAGVVALPLSVPESRLSGGDPRALLTASTRRLQLRLLRQCAHYTPSDLVWMSMTNFAPDGSATRAAAARGEREWDPQGLAALLINSPSLPGFDEQLETRQVLWPFNTAGMCTNGRDRGAQLSSASFGSASSTAADSCVLTD